MICQCKFGAGSVSCYNIIIVNYYMQLVYVQFKNRVVVVRR